MSMKKQTITETKGEALNPTLSIESPIELENNNNVSKDMPLFNECIEKFSDIEVKFILMQLNRDNMMGKHITRTELKMIEQEFILKVISNSPVAEYGALIKNIIQTKLINSL